VSDPFARVPGYRDAGAPPKHTIDLDMILPPKTQATWRSSERLYLDSKGGVVRHGDPDAQVLLVAEGGEIPLQRAQELGLVVEATGEPEETVKVDLPALAAEAGMELVAKGMVQSAQEAFQTTVRQRDAAQGALTSAQDAQRTAEAQRDAANAAKQKLEGERDKARHDLKAATTERDGLKTRLDAATAELKAANAELTALKAKPQEGG